MPHLHVALVPAPDQVVVRLTGDADLSTVGLLADALSQAAGLGTSHVVVDVAAARFWDCSNLYALTEFSSTLAPAGRQCRVVGAPAATRRLVSTAGLDGRLELDGPLTGQDPVVPPRRTGAPAPAPTGSRWLRPEDGGADTAGRRPPGNPHATPGGWRGEDRPARARRSPGITSLRRWR